MVSHHPYGNFGTQKGEAPRHVSGESTPASDGRRNPTNLQCISSACWETVQLFTVRATLCVWAPGVPEAPKASVLSMTRSDQSQKKCRVNPCSSGERCPSLGRENVLWRVGRCGTFGSMESPGAPCNGPHWLCNLVSVSRIQAKHNSLTKSASIQFK